MTIKKAMTTKIWNLKAIATTAAIVLAAVGAQAQPEGPGGPPREGGRFDKGDGQCPGGPGGPRGHRPPPFEELDADGDGKLSAEEAAEIPPVKHEGFATLDADGDGYLTREELPAPPNFRERRGPHGNGDGPHGRPGPPDFAELDTDGDGKLSAEEAEVIPPVRHEGLEAFDTNKDGYLSEDELPVPPSHRGGPRGDRGHRPPPFEDLDTDGDGKLSATEAADLPPVQHIGFDELDKDDDGYLSREELPKPPRHRRPGQDHAHAATGDAPLLTNKQRPSDTGDY